ncbi:hypothetical protein I79_026051 [Cricetulus griseus]|uniref:Uncharacterized protein n=1 Tax=Cricetulus griseus TaxID=10029 RepID=G3IPW7_CRIGR|nr:hypothetical protein I79_026051 [Cricetulus griseus]
MHTSKGDPASKKMKDYTGTPHSSHGIHANATIKQITNHPLRADLILSRAG